MSISILLDGRDIREFGMYVLEDHEHPLLPDTRDKFITIPDVHGVRDMGSTLGPRYFYIPIGTIPQKNYEKIRRLTENFISLFIDQYGKPKYVKLTFSYYPERYYKVRYAGQLPLQQLVNMGVFTLPLIATDPFAYFLYSANEITWDKDIPIMSDVYWGTGINQFKINENQTLEIYNSGNIVIRPTFIITGSATSLTLAVNGKSFSLPSFSNVTYEINGENFTVFKNGVNNFSDKIGNDWLELSPGINQLTVTGTGLNIHLTVDYRFKYL